jgi:hypothetical protein
MTKREPWIVPVLAMLTCGLYLIYWQYVTTDELKRATGRDDLSPVMDLILSFVLCGFWGIWVSYRNAQIVHEQYVQRGMPHEDKSTLILILYVAAFFNGLTALLAPMILQEELNKLGDRLAGGSPPVAF